MLEEHEVQWFNCSQIDRKCRLLLLGRKYEWSLSERMINLIIFSDQVADSHEPVKKCNNQSKCRNLNEQKSEVAIYLRLNESNGQRNLKEN